MILASTVGVYYEALNALFEGACGSDSLQKYYSEEMQYFQSKNLVLDTSPIPFYLKSTLATEELGLDCKYELKTLVKELQETNS